MNASDDNQTHLNQDVNFKGKVSFNNSMTIEGVVEGNINSEGKLNITKTGQVKGEIKVKDLESEGMVDGNVTAKGTIKLDSTAKMTGSLKASFLKVDEGVIFVGKCDVNR